jgi:hypothetical protein
MAGLPLSDQPLTVHPAFSHAGANFLVMEPPALNSASCTSPKLQCSILKRSVPRAFSSVNDYVLHLTWMACWCFGSPHLSSVSSSIVCSSPSKSTFFPADL